MKEIFHTGCEYIKCFFVVIRQHIDKIGALPPKAFGGCAIVKLINIYGNPQNESEVKQAETFCNTSYCQIFNFG